MASHSQPPAQEFTRAIADAAAAGEEQELVPCPSAGPAAAVVDAAEWSVPPVQQFAPTTSISKPKVNPLSSSKFQL